VQLTVSSALPIQQATPCSKEEKEKDYLQDGDKMKKGKNNDHHDQGTIPNICHLPDPPTF
jgi:hypothetical protein